MGLAMYRKDKYAKKPKVKKKDKLVVHGKIYGSAKTPKAIRSAVKKPAAVKRKPPGKAMGIKKPFPKTLEPMLATLVDKPFDEEGWIYEIKWDGYRALSFLNKGHVDIRSRNNKSFNDKFYPVYAALQALKMNAVLDGEIIVVNDQGISNFGKLQNWRSEADGQLLYYVFDLLWYNGRSLLDVPLNERRELLRTTIPADAIIHISQAFSSSGTEFFDVAAKMKLEGIMAKKEDSLYSPGIRTREWLKIKISARHEVVIGGYTKNEGTNKAFSALLAGVFKNRRLIYTGKVGTGFSDQLQKEMMEQFKPLIRKTSPFESEPDVNKPSRFRPRPPKAAAVWLKPEIVCEVSYTEITSDGVMRHPSFEGLRTDKKASAVKEERPESAKEITGTSPLYEKKILSKMKKGERKTLLNPTEVQQEKTIGGHKIKFTNLDKIYWPGEKITKRDMLNYYYQAAPFILPYLEGRPESLNRFPNGIRGKSFYQKDVTGKVPDWIEKYPYTSQGEKKNFMICSDEASLLYMVSLGAIEINPWSSTIDSPGNPDWCIIDLDPDKNSFDQVIETARVVKQVLDTAGIKSYCKTSGSTGMHIYIPLGAQYDYEISKEFGRLIATLVHEQLPSFTSIERATRDRKGKLYIDFLQNRPQATLAAPYSLRPKPGATVSMPLYWDEIKKGLSMEDFNIHNAIQRMRENGDIFKPVLGKGIDIKKAISRLS